MRIGQQDLTAHVDFTQVAAEAREAGFQVSGFVTQGRFLLNSGILQRLEPALQSLTKPIEQARLLQQLQMLVSEAEMGEVFKVLLLTKGLEEKILSGLIEPSFVESDRLADLFSG